MTKKEAPKTLVHEPPGLELATTLGPRTVARLELLRIVTAWRPQWDAGLVIKAAEELEKYLGQ